MGGEVQYFGHNELIILAAVFFFHQSIQCLIFNESCVLKVCLLFACYYYCWIASRQACINHWNALLPNKNTWLNSIFDYFCGCLSSFHQDIRFMCFVFQMVIVLEFEYQKNRTLFFKVLSQSFIGIKLSNSRKWWDTTTEFLTENVLTFYFVNKK